jgi:molybdopterin adenylyltransferase
MYSVGIITASDKSASGQREDLSGPLIAQIMKSAGYHIAQIVIVKDEQTLLSEMMVDFVDNKGYDLIFTTGGTGFSNRDVTPEATLSVLDKQTPGISEAIRFYSLQKTPKAMLSRGVSGIRGNSLIINLPGSPKAVAECLGFIKEPLAHGLDILSGHANECARE